MCHRCAYTFTGTSLVQKLPLVYDWVSECVYAHALWWVVPPGTPTCAPSSMKYSMCCAMNVSAMAAIAYFTVTSRKLWTWECTVSMF